VNDHEAELVVRNKEVIMLSKVVISTPCVERA